LLRATACAKSIAIAQRLIAIAAALQKIAHEAKILHCHDGAFVAQVLMVNRGCPAACQVSSVQGGMIQL